ncbi:MAG: sigma-70 family RNA polymerase sigma factor [bacterium]|nr:sigma-70 family RNA polymerase sigma factor [bacterium]
MPSHPASTIQIETLLEYEPFVRSILRGMVSDENQVHDLVQETWVRAMRRPPTESGAIKGWLARVAKNLVHDSRRRSATRTHRENAVSRPEADTSGAASEERLRLHKRIVDAVMELDEPYRTVMILTYYEELSANQIAARLDRKASTVRSQIHRAHETLRTKLDGDYGSRDNWMVIATPMMKWDKSAGAQAAGFSIMQLASYAATVACLVGAGIWITSLLSNPDQAPSKADAGAQVVNLRDFGQGDSNSSGSGANTNPSAQSDNPQTTGNSSDSNANETLAANQVDTQRALPLMDWSVLVTQAGKPVEGVPVFLRLEGDGPEVESDPRVVDMGFTPPKSGVHQTWLGHYSLSDPGLAKATTASNGEATFSLSSRPKMLWALTDKGSITKAVEADSGPELQVELLPGFAIHVQVVDRAGKPVSGVPILWQMSLAPEGKQYGAGMENNRFDLAWSESEGAEGRAVFYHQGELGGPAPKAEDGQKQYFAVRLGIPGQFVRKQHIRKGQGASIESPVRLVVPATGSLKVRIVESDGETSERPGRVLLAKDLVRSMDGEISSYAEVVDGVAHFPMVALGCQYQMTFHSPQTGAQWKTTVQGPVDPSEQTVSEFRGTFGPLIRGRITGPAGPFGNWSEVQALCLFVLDAERKELQRIDFRARPDGSFEVSVDPKAVAGKEISLQLVGYAWTDEELRPRWNGNGMRTLEPGVCELGSIQVDWVLDRVRGRVLDSQGDPMKGANVNVQADRWKFSHSDKTDSNGEFNIQAVLPAKTLLTVSKSLGEPEQQIDVIVSEDKVHRIVLKSYARMSGKFTAPTLSNGNYYSLKVVHHELGNRVKRPRTAWPETDKGRYELDGIPEGIHLVQIMLGKASILEIPNVHFKAGESCLDARIVDINLTDHLSRWQFKFQDSNGKPLERVFCTINGPEGQVASCDTYRKKWAEIYLPKDGEWELTAQEPGTRPKVVTLTGEPPSDPQLIQLRSGISVRLTCQQNPPLEKGGQRVRPSLGRLDQNGNVEGHESHVSLSQYFHNQRRGEVIFPGPGKYVLLTSTRNIAPPGGLVMASVATRCKLSDFVLEVKESDAGKTLDLVLPEDLFQDQ